MCSAMQKLLTFFSGKSINVFATFQDRNFMVKLANNFVKFWIDGPRLLYWGLMTHQLLRDILCHHPRRPVSEGKAAGWELIFWVTPLRKHAYSNIWKISPPKKIKNFQIRNSDILHISAQNIDCGYSLEPPQRGSSNEYPQSMFYAVIRKIMYTSVNPSFTI